MRNQRPSPRTNSIPVAGLSPFSLTSTSWPGPGGRRAAFAVTMAGYDQRWKVGLPGEEMVASYLYQVHLYLWLEINDYGLFLVDNDL